MSQRAFLHFEIGGSVSLADGISSLKVLRQGALHQLQMEFSSLMVFLYLIVSESTSRNVPNVSEGFLLVLFFPGHASSAAHEVFEIIALVSGICNTVPIWSNSTGQ